MATWTTSTLTTHPSLLWLVHPLIVPLPAEPIGVGARWTTTQPLAMDGASGTAERTYELAGVTGDALTIHVSGATHWRGGPGSDEEATEDIAGSLVVDPADVLARSGDVTYTEHLGDMKALVAISLAP